MFFFFKIQMFKFLKTLLLPSKQKSTTWRYPDGAHVPPRVGEHLARGCTQEAKAGGRQGKGCGSLLRGREHLAAGRVEPRRRTVVLHGFGVLLVTLRLLRLLQGGLAIARRDKRREAVLGIGHQRRVGVVQRRGLAQHGEVTLLVQPEAREAHLGKGARSVAGPLDAGGTARAR